MEGLEETLIVIRLGLLQELRRSLACTNIIEKAVGTVRQVTRNVKRWRNTEMALVFRDNMAPGWSATLDGKHAELLVVDGVNKAVAVPPGQHQVEFVYRPWPYLVAFALRALAMLAAVVACAWLAVRARAKPRAT